MKQSEFMRELEDDSRVFRATIEPECDADT